MHYGSGRGWAGITFLNLCSTENALNSQVSGKCTQHIRN